MGSAQDCQNKAKIDICKAGCTATSAVCGGLCDAGNGICWVGCESGFGLCEAGCFTCDGACEICCADPFDICNCDSCRDDCDDCHQGCANARNDCHDGCQLDCDACILDCEDDCQSICRPFRQAGEFCTPLIDRCDDGLICWPIPFPGELRQRCFPSDNDTLIDDETCRSFYSRALHEGAQDLGLAQSYGTGGSAAIGGGLSQEVGVVYSTGNRFGCYTTYCFGVTTDVATGIYAAVGFYIDYESFQGESVVFIKTVGEGLNFSTSQVLNTSFDLIGTADALSLGVSILPFDIGVYDCVTIVDTVGEYDETTDTLVPVTNSAPLARCADRAVCADSQSCRGTADVNNESTDPDGDRLTFDYHGPRDYPIGITDVTLTVRDPGGLSSECAGVVTVEDCTPPTMVCPDTVEVDCEGDSLAIVDPGAAKVSDCTKATVTAHEPAEFPIGVTELVYTAVDTTGLKSTCTQTIMVLAPDHDGDQVPDCNDLCPTLPARSPDGCARPGVRDDDEDDVPDSIDECLGTPRGKPVDETGCPILEPATLDADGDGVTDDLDACAGTPTGVVVNADGCPINEPPPPAETDADSDGISDEIDACPDTPAGTVVGADGCPVEPPPAQEIPDSDGDGVSDDEDECLGTAAGVDVDDVGCPVELEVDDGAGGVIHLPCGPFNPAMLLLTLTVLLGFRRRGR